MYTHEISCLIRIIANESVSETQCKIVYKVDFMF